MRLRLREAKGRLSTKLKLRTRWRWRGVKRKKRVRVRTEERGEDPPTSRFIFVINLFKTVLIGLNYLLFYFMSGHWTEDMFLFGNLPVFVNTERYLKVATSRSVCNT